MKAGYEIAWTTEDELIFLQGLGKWTGRSKSPSREILLESYYAAAVKRENWGEIDKEVILDSFIYSPENFCFVLAPPVQKCT